MNDFEKNSNLKALEKKLRDHPIVAPRLRHARDMHAAEAAVRECIYEEPVTITSWQRSATYQQVKMAFEQIKKQQQGFSTVGSRT